MEDKIQYEFNYKDIKNTLSIGIPLITYIFMFLFSLLFQIIDAKFYLKLIITAEFWIKLAIKYLTIILLFFFCIHFLKRNYKMQMIQSRIVIKLIN